MRSMTWLWLIAAGGAAPMACTFGADDFKVVAAGSGGDNVNGGGDATAGKGTGGKTVNTGGDGNPGTGGAPDTSNAGAGTDTPTPARAVPASRPCWSARLAG